MGERRPGIAATMAAKKDTTSTEEKERFEMHKERFDESIIFQSDVLEQILDVEYGFLPEEHPITVYIQSRLDAFFPDLPLRAKVASNEDEPNALSMANGAIVVTKGLLQLLETQDELDFVLAHEAIHYKQGHVQEIDGAIREACVKYQSLADRAWGRVRLMGMQRFSEYEADIRGLLHATDNGVNPVAARNVFVKLDDYAEKKGLSSHDVAHGSNLARMVNIGSVGKLVDYRSNVHEQESFPQKVSEFAGGSTEKWLYDKIPSVSQKKDVRDLVKRAQLSEIVLAARKVHKDLADRTEESVYSYEDEQYDYFYKNLGLVISGKVVEALPTLSPEDHAFLTHSILEVCVGVRTNDAAGTVLEKYTETLVDIDSIDTLKSGVALLTPEVFEKLGIVIPAFTDSGEYVQVILAAANENKLFEGDEGFDAREYIDFVKFISTHFGELSRRRGFLPIKLEDLTGAIMNEAILNLDLEESRKPLMDLIERLADEGIKFGVRQAMDTIAELPYIELDDEEKEGLTDIIARDDQFAKKWSVFYEQLSELKIKKDAWREKKEEIEREEKKILREEIKDLENFEERREAEKRSYKRIDERLAMNLDDEPEDYELAYVLKMFEVDSIQKLEAFFIWLEEHVAEESDGVGLTEHSYEAMVNNWILDLIIDGVDFLPESSVDRDRELLIMLRSRPELYRMYTHHISLIYTVGEITYDPFEHDEKNPSMDERLNYLFEAAQIITGEHERLKGLDVVSFRPNKLLGNSPLHSDSETVKTMWEMYCDNFMYAMWEYKNDPSNKKKEQSPPKEFVSQKLRQMADYWFRYVDNLRSHRLAREIIEAYDFDLDDPQDRELLMYVAVIHEDQGFRSRLQAGILSRQASAGTFEDRLHAFFLNPAAKATLNKEQRELFIERDAQSFEELSRVEDVLLDQFESMVEPTKMGALALMEQFGKKMDMKEMFKLCMNASGDDAGLKSYFFSRGVYAGDDYDNAPDAAYVADQRTRSLFGINDMMRFAIVRELLIGEKGLLRTEARRKWLLKYMLGEFVSDGRTSDRRSLQDVMKEVLKVAISEVDEDMLFFGLAPLIHSRILRPPSEPTPWRQVFNDYYGFDLYNYSWTDGISDDEIEEERKRREEDEKNLDKMVREYKNMEQQMSGAGPRVLVTEDGVEDSSFSFNLKYVHQRRKLENQLDPLETIDQKKMATEEFVVKLAESLGAVGIRFLQVIGQYVDVPQRLQNMFRDAYDSVKGQSKLTASNTLKREWQDAPEYIERMVGRIGGGSLMSTYLCDMKDGSKRVVKVLNPNAEMYVTEVVRMLKRTFEILVETRSERYAPARAAIDEIEAWVIEDIKYDRFHETDPAFKEVNHGFTAAGHEYTMYVPQSTMIEGDGSDNTYVKVEEFVDGQTLVRPEELEDHDLKEIVSLITKNYSYQIMHPLKLGSGKKKREVSLVHADVHPGNFMVSQEGGEKRVAIIDRNNYIELDARDRAMIAQLFALQDVGQRINAFVDYVIAVNDLTDIPKKRRANIDKELAALVAQQDMIALSHVMVVLKKYGLKAPLKITLMIKNINGLHDLAKSAGFSSVAEAFAYSP